jgi:hypothetical protein
MTRAQRTRSRLAAVLPVLALGGSIAAVSAVAFATPPVGVGARSPHPTASSELSGWTKTGDEDGIVSYKREVRGTDIIALRGEGTVDAPLMRVVSVLLDYARAPEWVDSLAEVRVVRMIGPLEFIEYDHVATPPILQDRDFVCRGRLALDLAHQTFAMLMEPATDPAVPANEDYVRGELRGFWRMQAIDGGRKTSVVAEMLGDPKGGVPKWLVNLFQESWAHSTLLSLRAQVAKKDIRIIPQVRAAFEGKPVDLAAATKIAKP